MKKLMLVVTVAVMAAFVTDARATGAMPVNHVRHLKSAYATRWAGSPVAVKNLEGGKSMEASDYGCCKTSSHKKCCAKKKKKSAKSCCN
jgi:hypothetical protein